MKHAVLTNILKNKNVMSKNLFACIVAALLTVTSFAQAPEQMSYQAVVRDASVTLVANQVYDLDYQGVGSLFRDWRIPNAIEIEFMQLFEDFYINDTYFDTQRSYRISKQPVLEQG